MNRGQKRRQKKQAPKASQTTLELAIGHHTAGRLNKAEELYRQVLQADPDHPQALHLLGVIALQGGDNARAIELISSALAIKPDFAEASGNLAGAHYNLGNTQKAQGAGDQAMASFRKVIAINPDFAQAHNNLGNLLQERGELEPAAASFRRALAIKPDYAQAHNNLGTTLNALGDPLGAEHCYRHALSIDPDSAQTHNNIGNALKERGLPAQAIESLQKALAINPHYAQAHNNLGNVYKSQGKLDAAVDCYKTALSINPDFAEAHINIGNALESSGDFEPAIEHYQQALGLNPQSAAAHNNLANVYKNLGQYFKAVDSYRQAISSKPDYAQAHNNLGNVFKELGRLDDAAHSYRKALSIKPDYHQAHSNLVFALLYSTAPTAADILEETRRWDKQHSDRAPATSFDNSPQPDRKIRVGYFSADFRMHAASYLLEPLLAQHDKSQVELFCYAEVARPDPVSARFKGHCDHWRSSVGLSDQQLVALIRADMIDILVDCTGHTAGGRLRAFSSKPAPIMVNHFIMHGTTCGLGVFDFVLSDPLLTPPGLEGQFSEQVVSLPRGAFAFYPDQQWPDVAPPRQQDAQSPVFACVGDPVRIGPQAIALWSRLLEGIEGAQMIFKHGAYNDPQTRQYWQDTFKELGQWARFEGVDGGWGRNMNFYGRVDVVLDTLPMSGGTSCIIPLWMGVPTLTMAGAYYAHRSGTAMVSFAGMAELSVENAEDYLSLANQLINDRSRLNTLRATLRQTIKASPIMDARGHRAAVEGVFRKMWHTWCAAQH